MILRPEMRHFQLYDMLLEFKYVKPSALNLDGRSVRTTPRKELLALAPVQNELAAARRQGQAYGAALLEKYGATFKLRTFAVVALGFERLVWQAVGSDLA
jgi:hypothetical protein